MLLHIAIFVDLLHNIASMKTVLIKKSRTLYWFLFNQFRHNKRRLALPATISSAVRATRISVSVIVFMHGLCFASRASRIPTIQENLLLTASILGAILFALPVGFFISLPFAGWLVGKIGSKKVATSSAVLYSLSLLSIGASTTILELALSLFSFGFFANLLNISVNTQAVVVERLFNRKLMATFHGLWSLAGFTGAAIGTWMIRSAVSPFQHY